MKKTDQIKLRRELNQWVIDNASCSQIRCLTHEKDKVLHCTFVRGWTDRNEIVRPGKVPCEVAYYEFVINK
jgi:hypothetical protein